MIELISSYPPRGDLLDTTSAASSSTPTDATTRWDSLDFQAMVDGDDSSESLGMVTSPSTDGLFVQMIRNVDSSKAELQSALLNASVNPRFDSIQRATAALSKHDLESLLLSKLANKGFQAVDRLTNLQ